VLGGDLPVRIGEAKRHTHDIQETLRENTLRENWGCQKYEGNYNIIG
jgi:hypothetical protein